VDSQSGTPIEATVKQVGVMAQSGGWMNPDLREYSVRVALPENAGTDLKPGMRANGEILTGRVDNAISIPVQAVFAHGDAHYSYVPSSGGKVQRQTVALGQSNESFVAVTEGLAPGDRVLLRRPRPSELSKEELEEMEKIRTDEGSPDEDGQSPATPAAPSNPTAQTVTPAGGAPQGDRPQRRERPAESSLHLPGADGVRRRAR
jgi:hypothetical protein